jgi:hypothetical protein
MQDLIRKVEAIKGKATGGDEVVNACEFRGTTGEEVQYGVNSAHVTCDFTAVTFVNDQSPLS